jgi:hypothetical protein
MIYLTVVTITTTTTTTIIIIIIVVVVIGLSSPKPHEKFGFYGKILVFYLVTFCSEPVK